MPIEIQLTDDQIQRPAVARALADLMLGLGGVERPVAAAAEVQPPASSPAVTRPPTSPRRKARTKDTARAATPPTWDEFFADLSPNTQTFISLVMEKRQLTMAGAQEALDKPGKAIGGLTGALSRRANNAGVELPFSRGKNKGGKRAWFVRPKVAAGYGITAGQGAAEA